MPACKLELNRRLMEMGRGILSRRCKLGSEDLAFVERLLASLLVALDAAHEPGIVWGDLKPTNMMLAPSGAPQILDFGSAARVPLGGLRHAPIQSPGFGAPECLRSSREERGCAIDVWGLGSLAAYAVLGFHPWYQHVDSGTNLLDPEAAARAWPSAAEGAPAELGALRDLAFGRLLVADPSRRVTAAYAMGHPYFEGLDRDAVRSGEVWA